MRIRMLSDTNADRMLLEYECGSDYFEIRHGYEYPTTVATYYYEKHNLGLLHVHARDVHNNI